MAIISGIPIRYQSGFNILLKMNIDLFNELQSKLDSVKDAYTLNDLVSQVAQNDNSINQDDLKEIVTSIKSILTLIEKDDIKPEDIANDIFSLIESDKAENIKYDNESKDDFIYKITSLIQNKCLGLTSKASEVLTANQNNFISAKIITDIRPIFSDDATQSPRVVSIVHDLKLHYEDSQCSEHKDIYISLDINEINILTDLLKRAVEKEKSIIDMLKDTSIRFVNFERSDK